MFDYKEILRKKADELRGLIAKYGSKIEDSKRSEYQILINNVMEITNGRLDALDYDVREEGIQNYTRQLDRALEEINKLELSNENNDKDYE